MNPHKVRDGIISRIIVHDMINYMQAIESYNRLLSEGVRDDGLRHLIEAQGVVINSAKAFLKDIRILNKAMLGELDTVMDREGVALREVIERAGREAEAMYPEKALSLEYKEVCEFKTWISEALSVIVRNLVGNSLEHSGNVVGVWVGITAQRTGGEGNSLELRFRDNGPGFELDAIRDITAMYNLIVRDGSDKYMAKDKDAIKVKQPGLGLFTVKFLTECLGGDMDLANWHEGGSGGAEVVLRWPLNGLFRALVGERE